MLAQGPLGTPVFVALSAHEQVSADLVALAGLSGDGQAAAVVAFLADEAYWIAAAGLVLAVHPSEELPFGFADKGFPFGWTREVLPFDSLVGNHFSGLGHVGHPRKLEHGDHPSRMIW